MRAVLLDDAPPALLRACAAAEAEVVRVRSPEAGRALLARERFDLVDGRLARPLSLEGEIRHRVDLFYDQLRGHSATGLYRAVVGEVERALLSGALARARGVHADAARVLGIDRGTLARRLRSLGARAAAPAGRAREAAPAGRGRAHAPAPGKRP